MVTADLQCRSTSILCVVSRLSFVYQNPSYHTTACPGGHTWHHSR